jgi:hypothetical protein
MRALGSVVLAAFSAYAFSFAVDLLASGVMGVYPSTAFAAIALAGAVVGHHPQNWPVAAFMFLQTLFVRRATRQTARQHVVAGPA